MFVKRLVAAVAVATFSVIGIAPAATAASSSDTKGAKTSQKPASGPQHRIDWD
ncbi:MAG: hypothetical protein WB508_02805 [Aeromicrobium sp.]|uniref:hypothetical protein n=1 Tax=Aeromicrobium sp. TaxID=1871063 RepID=UPI003C3CF24E